MYVMGYELRDIEPLETRVMTRSAHMADNDVSNTYNFHLLVGNKNTFPFAEQRGHAVIYTPFESKFEEPLADLLKDLKRDFSYISLSSFQPSWLDNGWTIERNFANSSIRLYQTPKDEGDYEKRLKRFENTGYEYKELGGEDIPAIIELSDKWNKTKRDNALSINETLNFNHESEITSCIQRLEGVRDEIESLRSAQSTPDRYVSLMDQPLTKFYGSFRDGELLAYIRVSGNQSMMAFESRVDVRANSHSPQEFLDLSLARDFVRSGVPLFERGIYGFREGQVGLITYKEKFGKIQPIQEADFNQVKIFSPEYMTHLIETYDLIR